MVYLPRLENYAETLDEYRDRRELFDQCGLEVPLDLVRKGDFMQIADYIYREKERIENRNKRTDESLLSENLE